MCQIALHEIRSNKDRGVLSEKWVKKRVAKILVLSN